MNRRSFLAALGLAPVAANRRVWWFVSGIGIEPEWDFYDSLRKALGEFQEGLNKHTFPTPNGPTSPLPAPEYMFNASPLDFGLQRTINEAYGAGVRRVIDTRPCRPEGMIVLPPGMEYYGSPIRTQIEEESCQEALAEQGFKVAEAPGSALLVATLCEALSPLQSGG